jgi:hypothetical protein
MTELHGIQSLGRVALTALCIGTAATALSALPLGAAAFAKNSDHGGQGGNRGAGHNDHSGSGAGNGNGNGNGPGVDRGSDQQHDADNSGTSDDAGNSPDAGTGTDTGDDPSLSAHGLGKLNGFFHASGPALANASPNSAIGKISQTFGGALSDFAAAKTAENSGDQGATGDQIGTNPTPPAPTVEQLGAILAGATNKPVTAAQVQAIADRLAELHPEDTALGDFAANADEAESQDIADAANAAHAATNTTSDADSTTATTGSQ